MMKNTEASTRWRTVSSVLLGLVAGFGGFTGLWGFLIYVVGHVCMSAFLLHRMSWKPEVYLLKATVGGFIFSGLGDNLLTFILFWALGYALIFIF
jgi:hypothetical protein